jgi:hypothetical protein
MNAEVLSKLLIFNSALSTSPSARSTQHFPLSTFFKEQTMTKFRLSLFLLSLFALLAMGGQVQAQANLTNPSFEEPYSADGAPQGWGRWHEDSGTKKDCATERYVFMPKWSGEQNTALILDGARSAHIGNQFDPWRAGLLQTVNVTPGTTYRFSVWGRGRGSNEQYPAPSDRSVSFRVRVAIDPTGSGNWTNASLVWSNAVSPHDSWEQAAVEVTATGDKLSLFVEADMSGVNNCRAHLDAWFDKAELTAVNTAPPPAPTLPPLPPAVVNPPPVVPQPTAVPPTAVPATPTNVPAPTAVPPTPTPTGGTICANAFGDNNGNGLKDADEGYMAGVRFIVAANNSVVGEAVSTGRPEPVCFNWLPAGNYQVGVTLPNTLEPTTATNITVPLQEGQTLGLEFGTRVRTTPTEIAQVTPEGGATATPVGGTGTDGSDDGEGVPTWVILVTVIGGIAFVILFGLVIYLITLLRKQ